MLDALLVSLTAVRAETSGFSRNEAKEFWKVVPPRKGDVAPCRPWGQDADSFFRVLPHPAMMVLIKLDINFET